MASTIAAITTGVGGVVTTADASGNLNLLAGTTTVVALTTAGAAVTGTLGVTGVATLGNGAILGTPASLVGTNITGTASGLTAGNVTTNANLTGAIISVGNATSLGSFSSANLSAALTDETGTGAAVFATSPTLVTPALGTPASGTVTNLTGTASININGTVGATTPAAGAFTTLSASGAATLSTTLVVTGNAAVGTTILTPFSTGRQLQVGAGGVLYGHATDERFAVLSNAYEKVTTGNWTYITTKEAVNLSMDNGALSLQTAPSGTADTTVTWTERFAVGNTGAVSIPGTLAAGATTVTGTLSATGITTVAAGSAALPAIVSTTGTADTGLWFPAADTVAASTAGTERLRIDSSGNVGIGTSSPSALLDLQSSGTTQLEITSTGASGNVYVLSSRADGTFRIADDSAGQTRLTIDENGNLGIGTTSPNEKLVVNGAIRSTNNAAGATATPDSGLFYFIPTADAPSDPRTVLQGVGTAGVGGSIVFFTGTSSSNSERARIDSSGNVGIGATSPSAKLHSYATSGTTTTLGRFEAAIGSYTGTSLIAANTLGASSTYNLFSCITDSDGDAGGPFTQFLVRGDGNVGIGTTSPANKLDLQSPSATALCFHGLQSGVVEWQIGFKASDSNFYVGTGSTLGGAGLYQTNTGTAWIAVSDERLKKDITPLDDAKGLAGLLKLNPSTFYWKSEDAQQDLQIGLIAQNVQEHFPDLVSMGPVSEAAPDGAIGVNYTGFIAPLIKAIQELKAIIDTQATRIAALEAK